MKMGTSGERGSAAKGDAAPKNVDEYLAGVPEPARSTLNRVRRVFEPLQFVHRFSEA